MNPAVRVSTTPKQGVCGSERSSPPCWFDFYSHDKFIDKKGNPRVGDMSTSDLLCPFGSLAPKFYKEWHWLGSPLSLS